MKSNLLTGKSILITGGTGSFGKSFINHILKNYSDVRRVIIYSRDELKQYEISRSLPETLYPQLRYFIGDVRDADRLKRACEGVDIIIHAAALKQVPTAEYNPMECINTNILGAENVINAAMDCDVSLVVALSTDKAAAPINLYGATKLCSDKLFIAANNMCGHRKLRFSVVRYGNVLGSRGSVVPFFLEQRSKGSIPITDPEMTRFNITLEEGVKMVLHAIENSWGGELFVPKIPSFKVTDLAEAVCPGGKIEIIGIRPGEKIHEEMITQSDSLNTYDCGNYYVILPSAISQSTWQRSTGWNQNNWLENFKAKLVSRGFCYSSGNNSEWLNVTDLRKLIKQHVDPNFEF
jgi:UDP-N-acetylglucosamine 4,6-dehydratase